MMTTMNSPQAAAVVEQATNKSLTNQDPAIVRGAVVGIVTAIGSILVIGGYLSEEQKAALVEQAGILVPAVFILASIVQAVWTRAGVWSPKTAAEIALVNTEDAYQAGREALPKPAPTLIPPP